MIKEVISALKEKGGSSPRAIAKYMEEKHKVVLPPGVSI
jgi:histone H1/5